MTTFHEASLCRESSKSMLSWNLTKLFFCGKIPSIRAPFQSLFPGFLQSLFPGFDRRGSNIGREFIRNSIIWISINWKLDYLDFNSDGHMISLTINVCVK